MSKIKTMDEALDLIQDGAVVASSGFIIAGTAESILKALGERYEKTGHPAISPAYLPPARATERAWATTTLRMTA
jgi:acyl CoA:acetate/3-ketoacid CoA transferase